MSNDPAESTPPDVAVAERRKLRTRLRAERELWTAEDAGEHRSDDLSRHLLPLLLELSPERLGLYWSIRSEFNAAAACLADTRLVTTPFALPYCIRSPIALSYRAWNRQPPTVKDECGIATGDGPAVEPDVVLVPCVGFTASGYRLGYGGGYFDRWMAAHPHVTAVGVAWSIAQISEDELKPQAHDRLLTLVVTERGVV